MLRGSPRDMGGGTWHTLGQTSSGKRVTPETAMRTSTVFACVRVISETLATLPVHVYEKNAVTGKSRRAVVDHPLSPLLKRAPNPEMTSVEFFQLMFAHRELRGNAYAEIVWAGPRVAELWPLHPDRVKPDRDKSGSMVYVVSLPGGQSVTLPKRNVLHMRSMPLGNYAAGISPVGAIAETIALNMSAQEFGARVFDGDGLMRMALRTDQPIRDKETLQDLKDTWTQAVGGGLKKSHRLAILHSGLAPVEMGINPRDAQLLELGRATQKDIISAFRLPPHKVGVLDDATFSNIEEQSIEFVTDSIVPRAMFAESAMNMALLVQEPDRYIKFNVDGLLRGDINSRMSAHATAIQWGIKSPNECREDEDLNPYEGGDVFLQPLNMQPTGVVPEGAPSADGDPGTKTQMGGSEKRAKRARDEASAQILRDAWKPQYEQAYREILRRWGKDIDRAIGNTLDVGSVARWDDFVSEFLENGEEYAASVLRPVVDEHGAAVAANSARMVSGQVPDSVAAFIEQRRAASARSVSTFTANQIAAIRAKYGDDYTREMIQKEMQKHADSMPAFFAEKSVVQGEGDISRHVWQANGVQRLVWVAAGSETCPICQELDGRVVGIESSFVNAGDQMANGYAPSFNALYPPLHDGCVCTIVPE